MKTVFKKLTMWMLAIMLVVTLVPQMSAFAFGAEDNNASIEEGKTPSTNENTEDPQKEDPSEGYTKSEPEATIQSAPEALTQSAPEITPQSENYEGGLTFYFEGKQWNVNAKDWGDLDSIENTHYSKAVGGGDSQKHYDDVYSGKKLESAIEQVINTYTADDVEYDRDDFADYNVEITTNTNSKFSFTIGELFKTRYYFASASATGVKVVPILVFDSDKINIAVGQDGYAVNNGMYCVNDVKEIAISKPGENTGSEITADYSDADTSWYTKNKTASNYEISTKAELIGLAKIVNVGENGDGNTFSFKDRTIKLTTNILLNNNCYPIGRVDTPFEGTFDGNGNGVVGIKQKNNISYMGLFGYNLGTITKLVVSGSITNTSVKKGEQDFIGGVCGFNAGTISKVRNRAAISAGFSYNVGGIAGFNTSGKWIQKTDNGDVECTVSGATGKIYACENRGNVTGNTKVGGISGENAGEILECINSAKIDGTNASSGNGVAGIAGRNGNNNIAYETGIVESCYNTGEVGRDSQKWIGGMTGFQNAKSKVSNSYSVGLLPGDPYGYCNPITGKNEGTTSNNYSLSGLTCTSVGAGTTGAALAAEQGIVKTDAEFKSLDMITALGNAYQAKSDSYPILSWETTTTFSKTTAVEVISLINSLPEASEVTVASQDEIEYARAEYDGMTQEEKDKVTNYSKLTSDEASLQSALEELMKLDNAKINLKTDSYVYTGAAIVPEFTVTGAKGELLKANTDYTVSCSDNVNVGENALLTVEGKGNYSGSKSTNFTIKKANIASKSMRLSGTLYNWTGKAITPRVTVSGCKYETDYTQKYSSGRTNVGRYAVTVYGKGNYEGSKTLRFTVGPRGVTIKTPAASKKALTAKWKRQSGKMPKARVTGYQVQVAKNSKFTSGVKTVKVKGYKITSKKISRLYKKTRYYVRVRTYLKTGGTTYYSTWSKVKVKKTK